MPHQVYFHPMDSDTKALYETVRRHLWPILEFLNDALYNCFGLLEATNDRGNSFQYLELNKGSFRLGYQTGLTVQVTSIPVYVVHILDTVCDTQLSQMFQEG